MKVEMCDEFYYRVNQDNENLYNELNTSKENITRNNLVISLYKGEWVKVKVNNFVTHFVKPMETLEQISKLYNISLEEIKKDNNLKSEKLYIGQRLKIFKKQ